MISVFPCTTTLHSFRCTSLQEALRMQLEGKSHVSDAIAKEVSSALVLAALKKGTLDNVTVLVLLLRWD